MAIPKSAHYRPATSENKECGKCRWFVTVSGSRGRCRMYSDSPVNAEYVCDNFQPAGKDKEVHDRD